MFEKSKLGREFEEWRRWGASYCGLYLHTNLETQIERERTREESTPTERDGTKSVFLCCVAYVSVSQWNANAKNKKNTEQQPLQDERPAAVGGFSPFLNWPAFFSIHYYIYKKRKKKLSLSLSSLCVVVL